MEADIDRLRLGDDDLIEQHPVALVDEHHVAARSWCGDLVRIISNADERLVSGTRERTAPRASRTVLLPLAADEDRVVPRGRQLVVGEALRPEVIRRVRTAPEFDRQ